MAIGRMKTTVPGDEFHGHRITLGEDGSTVLLDGEPARIVAVRGNRVRIGCTELTVEAVDRIAHLVSWAPTIEDESKIELQETEGKV